VTVREFAETRDLMPLQEKLIFNCIGLGARTLFKDEELIPSAASFPSCCRSLKWIT